MPANTTAQFIVIGSPRWSNDSYVLKIAQSRTEAQKIARQAHKADRAVNFETTTDFSIVIG